MAWLTHILDILFPPRPSELVVRNMKSIDLIALVNPQERFVGDVVITSLLPYENPFVQSCILEAKFHNNRRATQILAKVLQSYLPEHIGEALSYGRQIAIVPIPLSRRRARERGYNQVFKIVSLAVAREGLSLLLPEILHRRRDTVAQTTLSGSKRRENMHGAFQADVIDKRMSYLIIDDVSTTGATLCAAHKTLVNAGATHITLLSLAH